MNSAEALDMLRMTVEDPDGDLHIVWEDVGCFKRRTLKPDNTFGPIELINQDEFIRLTCIAIRSGAMDLLESVDRDGNHGYDLVPHNDVWPNVIGL